MPRKGERKCKGCGEFFDPDYDGCWITRGGEVRCEGCYHAGIDYASTVVAIEPQTEADDVDNETLYSLVTVTKFDDDFTYFVHNGDGEFADWEEDQDYPEPVKIQGYHRTDGWRGYTTFEFLEGFETVESGWVTGYPDETTRRKADLGELFEDLKSGELVPPVALYWVFGVTSNVFSTACDIVVRSEDREQLESWLEECAGTSLADLHHQLG